MEKSEEKTILTMDDIKEFRHNFLDEGNSIERYELNKNDLTTLPTPFLVGNWSGKKVSFFSIRSREQGSSLFGIAIVIKIDDKIEYLIGIDRLSNFHFNEKRGLVLIFTFYELIEVWLDDGEINNPEKS